MKRLWLVGFLLLPLCACNRAPLPESSARSAADPDRPVVAAADAPATASSGTTDARRPVLVAFGDSLTAGFGAEPGRSFPDYLQKELDTRGYHYHVVNEGVSGETTKDGLERVDEVLALHPEVVIVEFGGNDGLRGVPPAQMQQNLDRMVGALTAAHTKVVIAGITMPPNYGAAYIKSFNAVFPAVASHYHVPVLPFLLVNVWDVPGDMQRDGIHPTAQGNQQVAKNLLATLEPLLKK